jgi:4'-phosphopantetheinyl transferase
MSMIPVRNAMHAAFREAFPDGTGTLARAVGDRLVAVTCLLDDWWPFLSQARALLDDAELARAGRQRDPRKRDALVLTYALHRLLLAEASGQAPGGVDLFRDAKGCPRLRGTGLHTSLSHTDAGVAFAVSAHGPVGVDLEPAQRVADMPAIRERIVHPDDEQALLGLSPEAETRALLGIWVRKEAVLKAAGIGLECEMDAFAAFRDGEVAIPGGVFAGMLVSVRLLDAGPRWMLAVAGPAGLGTELLALRAQGVARP